MQHNSRDKEKIVIYLANSIIRVALLFVLTGIIFISCLLWRQEKQISPRREGKDLSMQNKSLTSTNAASIKSSGTWLPPDEGSIPAGNYGNLIRYGKELIAHTGRYFGPNGRVASISNGMNCQNCHLDGGRKLFGNNFSVFYATYPKKTARSGRIESVRDRVDECFQRSLNGKLPDTNGKELRAMLAYLKWIGSKVRKQDKIIGTGSGEIEFLDRPADPKRGLLLYTNKCRSCHGDNGQGVLHPDKQEYRYPPLWGKHSYNDGAGLYRLGKFATFIKNNMPYGASHDAPQLRDDEAWDIAAFVNSQPRPHKDSKNDYKDLSKKPIDAPFGPYADGFSEQQHKYGPFKSKPEKIRIANQ
jgi:thiosulfate dehydrogenase